LLKSTQLKLNFDRADDGIFDDVSMSKKILKARRGKFYYVKDVFFMRYKMKRDKLFELLRDEYLLVLKI
jgi:hypothetical protein